VTGDELDVSCSQEPVEENPPELSGPAVTQGGDSAQHDTTLIIHRSDQAFEGIRRDSTMQVSDALVRNSLGAPVQRRHKDSENDCRWILSPCLEVRGECLPLTESQGLLPDLSL